MNNITATYNWKFLPNTDESLTKKLSEEIGISSTIANLLINRNITSYETAKKYFRPTFEDIHNPFLMNGMYVAVKRIFSAIESKEKIFIFGDYDVDGINGVAMLYLFLKSIGGNLDYYVPDRFTEGYGLSKTGIDNAKGKNTKLLITVDCGITAVEQVEYANSLNIDVIICDHHKPSEKLPNALAILDALIPNNDYPYKFLCGTGVAFKLIHALILQTTNNKNIQEEKLLQFLQHVVLATAADIVPLVDENRVLIKIGLKLLNKTPLIGINCLVNNSGMKLGKISSGDIVFRIAPRINAAGRIGNANRAIKLLITDDLNEATEIAQILESENTNRKKIDEETFLEAQQLADEMISQINPPVLVLHKNHWHPGVIGIVASRIVEKYYRPTILLTTIDGKIKGSARSIEGFDIHSALLKVQDKLISFGGHKYAAGVSIEECKFEEFQKSLCKTVENLITDDIKTPSIKIDCEIDLNDITPKFNRILDEFAPFGPQNSRPIFLAKNITVASTPKIVGKNHLKFKVKINNSQLVLDIIGFGMGNFLKSVSIGNKIDIVFSLDEYNSQFFFNGNNGNNKNNAFPVLKLKDFKSSENIN